MRYRREELSLTSLSKIFYISLLIASCYITESCIKQIQALEFCKFAIKQTITLFKDFGNHDYYLNKIGLIIQSKLKIINSIRNLSGEEEIRTNLETLVSEGEYERIQLQKLDENRTNLENER
jgi:hypothetical protein